MFWLEKYLAYDYDVVGYLIVFEKDYNIILTLV